MSNLNQCNFTGNLGRDVELRYTPNGDAVAKFSIAVSWKTKDKDGTDWVPCVAYGKLAEVCGQYLGVGSRVRVTARYSTRQWEKDGKKQYGHEFRCSEVEFLSGTKDGGKPKSQPAQGAPEFDEDIPF